MSICIFESIMKNIQSNKTKGFAYSWIQINHILLSKFHTDFSDYANLVLYLSTHFNL